MSLLLFAFAAHVLLRPLLLAVLDESAVDDMIAKINGSWKEQCAKREGDECGKNRKPVARIES